MLLQPLSLREWKRREETFNFDYVIGNIMVTTLSLLKCFIFRIDIRLRTGNCELTHACKIGTYVTITHLHNYISSYKYGMPTEWFYITNFKLRTV